MAAERLSRSWALRRPAGLAAALAILAFAFTIALVALGTPAHQNELASFGEEILACPALGVLGFLVARRQPHNRIGWLILGAAAGYPLTSLATPYATMIYRLGYRLPAGPVAMMLGYSWIVPTGALTLALLLFPDGRLPSPTWRWPARAVIAAIASYQLGVYAVILDAVAGHRIRLDTTGGLAAVDFPAGRSAWFGSVEKLAMLVIAACLLSFAAAQVLSWRRADADRRQQLKWLLSGSALFLADSFVNILVMIFAPRPSALLHAANNVVSAVGLVALPTCMAVAILRYRLYDIDRLISRTLAYAIVTGLLAGLYASLVLLATRVLPFTAPVAVAIATLAAAAAFSPLRRRVQRLVDRRFNRARYDADRTVEGFAVRLRDAVDLPGVQADLLTTVRAAVEPSSLSVWVREGPR